MDDATHAASGGDARTQPWARREAVTLGFVLAEEQFAVPELVELGVRAERAGFDAIWTSDHYEPWQDNQGHAGFAWAMLAALGQRTTRIRMGTGVTCPTYRYRPAVVAEAFASLSLLTPGRDFLGVGTGEALNEVSAGGGWGPYRERADRLVEAMALIRELWTGEWVNYQGRYYQIHHSRLYNPPPSAIPIFVAAAGPKSARLAGRHGDGWVTNSEMATKPELRQAFAEGARAAGKDADTLPILAEHFVVVGDRGEAERWAQLWRFEGKADLLLDSDPVDIQRVAEREVPLESVYGKWAVSEDPAVHVEALQRLIDAGVTHVYVHSPQGDQARVIDFYGREVLPRVRRGREDSQRGREEGRSEEEEMGRETAESAEDAEGRGGRNHREHRGHGEDTEGRKVEDGTAKVGSIPPVGDPKPPVGEPTIGGFAADVERTERESISR